MVQKWWDGTSWNGWAFFPDGWLTEPPQCISRGSYLIDCFIVGTYGNMWQQAYDGSSWSGWLLHDGALSGGYIAPAPHTCISRAFPYIDCFAVDNAGGMWWKSLEA